MIKIAKLIAELNTSGLRYCHWKSNIALAESLSGQTDIDLLIHRQDAGLFRSILGKLCFHPAISQEGDSFPSVEHYFAMDEISGALVHVHAYFRAITGESLAKNYRFPIEEMLLQNTRQVDMVPVPRKSAELIVFTLRIMLKHTALAELFMLARYWKEVKREVDWLLEAGGVAESLDLLRCWLPSVDADLFTSCVEALATRQPLTRRILLGRRLRSQLKIYARHSSWRARLTGLRKFSKMAFRRLTRTKKGLSPLSGGMMIAFVGSEATGKSTMIAETRSWLAEHFAVEQIHAGKPGSTPLSALPNFFVPALRALLPGSRSTRIQAQHAGAGASEKPRSTFPLLFAIRSVTLAHDRLSLLTRAYRQAANGTIILSDRYPSLQSGAPDSRQLSALLSESGSSLRSWLAKIESRLYRQIPEPDLVIFLSAPLEVTLSRNAARDKREPEDYVRWRHARSTNLEFGKIPVYRINTDRPQEETLLEVKKAVWGAI